MKGERKQNREIRVPRSAGFANFKIVGIHCFKNTRLQVISYKLQVASYKVTGYKLEKNELQGIKVFLGGRIDLFARRIERTQSNRGDLWPILLNLNVLRAKAPTFFPGNEFPLCHELLLTGICFPPENTIILLRFHFG
jgi:hypothetical protein